MIAQLIAEYLRQKSFVEQLEECGNAYRYYRGEERLKLQVEREALKQRAAIRLTRLEIALGIR